MRENLFIICQQRMTVMRSNSRLFSVTICEQCGTSWCGILRATRISV
jgi:hypothetical protein